MWSFSFERATARRESVTDYAIDYAIWGAKA
jgi:hypothetical protein